MSSVRCLISRVVLSAALACGTAAGAAGVVFHPTYEAAAKAAREEGRLLLILVEAPVKDPKGVLVCAAFRERVLGEATVAELINSRFAPMILDIPKVRASKQKMPPPVHLQGNIRLPLFLVFDRDGKQVLKHEGFAKPAAVLAKLQEATKALEGVEAQPPQAVTVSSSGAEAAIKQAKAAVERKDYVAAMAALKPVLEGADEGAEKDAAQAIASEIEGKARELLDEGERLEAEPKLGTAIRTYRRCIREFHGAPAAQVAAERLKAVRGDKELRARLAAFLSRQLLARAKADMARHRYAAAAKALDTLVERYGTTPQAAEAKTLRETIRSDPKIAGRMKEESVRSEAERLLSLARSFRLSKMPDKAIGQCRLVIQKYPGTRFARSAESLIKDIQSSP